MSASVTTSDPESLLERLRRQCSVREYCRSDIRAKVIRYNPGLDPDKFLKILEDEGFLDESRYAYAYASDKMRIAGWGSTKVAFHLRAKGIPSEIIDKAISEVDPHQARHRMERVIAAKWKQISSKGKNCSEYELVAKLLRFAASRGYSHQQTIECLKSCRNSD